MTLGIIFKGINAIHAKNRIDFLHEFVPQFLLLLSMFGYMDLLIINKWLTDWSGDTSKAPSIINTMVVLFLNFGGVDNHHSMIIENQAFWNHLMIIIIVITVPWMLVAKPLIIKQ